MSANSAPAPIPAVANSEPQINWDAWLTAIAANINMLVSRGLLRNTLALTPEDYGATPNTGDNTNALTAWFNDVVATGTPGFLPPATYPCASQLTWDLTSAAATGVRIFGAGVGKSIISLSTSSSPALLIGGSTTLSNHVFSGFSVTGSVAGSVVRLGHQDYSDSLNACTFDIAVSNALNNSGAIAVEMNYVRDSRGFIVAACASQGDALRCRQVQFCTFQGKFATADNAIHFQDGTSYGNTWVSVNADGAVCVKSDTSSASRQTFIGGLFTWTGASLAVLNSAGNYFRFVGVNPSAGAPYVTGAAASAGQFDEFGVGDYLFGTVNKITITQPATGATLTLADGKTVEIDNTLTFTGTDGSSAEFGGGGTVAYLLGPVAFASLPAAGTAGRTAVVTDSNTAVWGATVAGGGANQVLAWDNGTNWTVIGA